MDLNITNKFIIDFSDSIEYESNEKIEFNFQFQGFSNLEKFILENKNILEETHINSNIQYNKNFYDYEELKEDMYIIGIEVAKNHTFKIKIIVNKIELINKFNPEHKIKNIQLFSSLRNFMDQVDLGNIIIDNLNYRLNVIITANLEEYYFNDYLNIIYTDNFDLPNSITLKVEEMKFHKAKKAIDLYSKTLSKNELSFLSLPIFWDLSIDNQLIKNKLILTFVSLISNKEVEKGIFNIKGQQNLNLNMSELNNKVNFENFENNLVTDLFKFTLDDEERFLEKILIIRNVLSTYLTNESSFQYFVNKLREISSTVEYNFEMYIQEKVKIFLDQKNLLTQVALDTARSTSKLTSQVTSTLRTVLFSLVGTVFISLVSNFDANISFKVINTSLLAYIFYFAITLLIVRHYAVEEENIQISFENYFKKISNEEIKGFKLDNIKEDFLNENHKEFKKIICS